MFKPMKLRILDKSIVNTWNKRSTRLDIHTGGLDMKSVLSFDRFSISFLIPPPLPLSWRKYFQQINAKLHSMLRFQSLHITFVHKASQTTMFL